MEIRFETQFGGRVGGEHAVPCDAISMIVNAVFFLNTEVCGEDKMAAECIRRIIFLFNGNLSDIRVDCIITVAQRLRDRPHIDHVFDCVVNWRLAGTQPAIALAEAILDKVRIHFGRPRVPPQIRGKMQFKVVN